MKDCECEELFSKTFPFWSKITEEQKKELCNGTVEAKYKKGDMIHGGDGVCTGGVLVKSGCVRVYLLSEDGREVTLYRLYPGDICMLSASCVIEAITFDVFVDAQEQTDCLIINGNIFAEISQKNIWAENYALNIAVSRFSDVIWVLQQILFMSFDKRLAIFLNDEISRTGSDTVQLTHEQIAKYIGSAREVVSRMLKYFAAEGIVEPLRGGVKVINKSKLHLLAVD